MPGNMEECSVNLSACPSSACREDCLASASLSVLEKQNKTVTFSTQMT